MKAKLIEIRDRMTFIPAVAIQCDPANESEQYLLSRAGYGRSPENQAEYILLAKIDGGELSQLTYDAYDWATGTMRSAHLHLRRHFNEIEPGDVIDVEFINGITSEPKKSERMIA